MTRDNALLNEIWSIVRPSIPPTERAHIADELVELFDEYGMADGMQTETDLDIDLKVAAVAFFGPADDDGEYDEQI